jgi:hypothetical protein
MRANHVIILSCTSQDCGRWVQSNSGMLISRGKPKKLRKKQLQCQVVQHESHKKLPGMNPTFAVTSHSPPPPTYIFMTLHLSNITIQPSLSLSSDMQTGTLHANWQFYNAASPCLRCCIRHLMVLRHCFCSVTWLFIIYSHGHCFTLQNKLLVPNETCFGYFFQF